MKNAIIIIPMGLPWQWSTDYYEQTARILAGNNTVLCLSGDNPITLKQLILQRSFPVLFKRIIKNLYVLQLVDFVPFRRFRVVQTLNRYIQYFMVQITIKFIKRKNKKQVHKILWLFDSQFVPLITLFDTSYRVIYDIVDYMRGAQPDEDIQQELDALEHELLKVADVVTVNSRVLEVEYKNQRSDVQLVPQGFSHQLFIKPATLPSTIVIAHDKPVIGYVGGLNYRLDYDLLIRLVKRNPHYHFVFAGQIQVNDTDQFYNHVQPEIQRLFSYANCHYIGNISKRSIPTLIKEFDIAIIPYDPLKKFNKYSYPMKLFEYFYMGKPVISTPIEELKRFPKYVHIGFTMKEWEEHITSFLSKPWPDSYKKEQKKLAVANSWERKIHTILLVID